MKKTRSPFAATALALLALTPVASLSAGQGGGLTAAGAVGSYYGTSDLSGAVAFERRDVRIDFDWGSVLPVGGSTAEPYVSFPTDNFSVRWDAGMIPAFDETYTFRVFADDGARLYVRANGSGTWTTVIDAWSGQSGQWVSGDVALSAGVLYDLRLEYHESTGDAAVGLYWSSPSFPEEVIDPLADVGSNVTHWTQVFADLVMCARNSWNGYNDMTPGMDADGWPTTDFAYTFQESLNMGLDVDPMARGTIGFRFNGRGDVSVWGNVDAGSVVSAYDAGTNTTTGTFVTQPTGKNASYVRVANTDRDGNYGADNLPDQDGVTNLQLMRPTAPDATTHYPFDTLFLPQARHAYGDFFTVLRSNLNNGNQESTWADRTLPTFFNQARGKPTERVYSNPDWGTKNNGASWEHKIMLCNEAGTDLYVNIPHMATGWDTTETNSYVYKLAQLIKYGSDGVNPYTQPTANPVYPPLNPNLRVYVELSNEVWNFGGDAFRQYWDIDAMTQADANAALESDLSDPLARPQDFPILNYDNLSTAKNTDGYYNSLGTWRFRKVMLRTIQISEIFRTIWGDDAMHSRVRPMYEWQYANTNNTAGKGLEFADEYFNNADGVTHVATPRPVSYYLWGGGGATYYGSSNGWAVTDLLDDPSFEETVLPAGYTEVPYHADWTFTGTAGIARDAGDADDIPPAWDGAQVAYIQGTGEISIDVTFPTEFRSNIFAVGFKALNRLKVGATESDAHKVQVFFDGQPINARSYSQNNGYVPETYNASKPWIARVVFWTDSAYYSTLTFDIEPGSTHTITFKGVGDADDALFLEDIRITHVDEIFDGDMPAGGSAAGQVNSSTYQLGLEIQNDWATAYGLNHITYEGGWSLGGDTGGAPIQNMAKYGSAEASAINELALDIFHRVGGKVNTLGTYAQWSSWSDNFSVEGLLDLDNNYLLQGQLNFLSKLPVNETNGTGIPNRLLASDIHIAHNTSAGASSVTLDAAGEWASWHVIAPQRGDYTFDISASGDGDFVVEFDGVIEAQFADAAGLTPIAKNLLKGQTGFRIRSLGGGAITITDIAVTNPDFVSAPAYSPLGGSYEYPVTISLSSETEGAAIRYTLDGSEPSETHGILYTTPFLVSVDTEVRAVAYKDGLNPSVAMSEFYQPAGGGNMLAVWDFEGDGGETSLAPEYKVPGTGNVIAELGPGLSPIDYGSNGLTARRTEELTLAGAIAAEDYFSIQIDGGSDTYAITSVDMHPVSQNRDRTFTLFSSTVGFAEANALGSFVYRGNNGSNTPFTIQLNGHTNLSGVTELRLYVHGFDSTYESVGIGNHTGVDLVVYGSFDSGTIAPRETWANGFTMAWNAADDSDQDGVSMLAEYALGKNPTLADATGATVLTATSTQTTFAFPRLSDRTDVRYVVQSSPDLSAWTDVAESTGGGSTSALVGGIVINETGTAPVSVTVEFTSPSSPLFTRLKLETME